MGREAAKYAKKVLLLYGSNSAKKSGLVDRAADSLKQAGIEVLTLGGVQSNPRLSLVQEGVRICRQKEIGLVLAVGGGSVIDSAKAIALGTVYQGDFWQHFYVEGNWVTDALPVAAVLTIPGAGSESSFGSVITHDETLVKLGAGGDCIRPVFSILNPELTYTVPAYHSAAGITDRIAHVLERYFTNTTAVDVTDRMGEGLICSLMKYAKIVLREPENYDARAEVMWACKLAHDNTVGFGRQQDWASHMLEHELSARYNISHGAGLAVIFPASMKYVYHKNIDRFAQFSKRVLDVEYRQDDLEWTAKQGINRLLEFFKGINMPLTLRELGITRKEDIISLAKACAQNNKGVLGSFAVLQEEDFKNIYEIAF